MKKIVLFALSFGLILVLSACAGGNFDDGPRQSAYYGEPHITNYEGLSEYNDKGNMYIIYVYSITCPACIEITDDVLNFMDEYGDEIPILFDHGAEGNRPVNVSYVPSFIVMKAGEVLTGPVVGVQPIRDLIDAISKGEFDSE